jgi:hypothetical protein
MTSNESLWDDLKSNLKKSRYQPYKLLFTPAGERIRLVKVNVDGKAFAGCPELGLIERAEEILDAWFQLAPRLQAALGLPSDTVFSQTCTGPFPIDVAEESPAADPKPSMEEAAISPPADEEQLALF